MEILGADETEKALPYSLLVAEIAAASRQLSSGDILAPERLAFGYDRASTILCMPAVGTDIGVVKVISVNTQNAAAGRPAICGEVIVFDASTGERLIVLDGPTVTARRTAAVTLLGIETLARRPPRNALIIGTGAQAKAHAEALISHAKITKLAVAGIDLPSAIAFCERLQRTHQNIGFAPIDLASFEKDACPADVVIALTTSSTPIVPASLPESTLAIGVGAFRLDMAELPPELLHKRRIVVDHLASARLEAGDLIRAGVDWDKIDEIAHAMDSPKDTTRGAVFKTVGHACWDLAAARVALKHLSKSGFLCANANSKAS